MQANIEGFHNYHVDKSGNVFNLDRPDQGAISTWIVNTGYLQVKLFKNGKAYFRYVHRLVALAWIENPNNHRYVLHNEYPRTNCNVSNLRWGTNSENTQEDYDQNAYKFKARAHKVIAIHKETEEMFEFPSIRNLSDTLGVNRKTVSAILKGEKKTNNYDYDFFYNMPND